jgi:hypothetical protein
MQHRLKSETRNLLALVAVMVVFAIALFFAGESVMPPRKTAQLAVPFERIPAGPSPATRPYSRCAHQARGRWV